MRSSHKGISLIELIIAITITSILALPLVNALHNMINTWLSGSSQLESIKLSHLYLDPLIEKLRFATAITDVSLSNNSKGYIQFSDTSDRSYTVCYNSIDNQITFGVPNSFPETSLIFFFDDISTNPELLLQHINSFYIETFSEDSSLYFKVVSPNNVSSNLSYNNIMSLKFTATVSVNSFEESIEQLIDLAKTPLALSQSLEIGIESLTFLDMASEYNAITIDDDFDFDGDALSLPMYDKTVKILHTSRYFSTISEAIEVATKNDVILVGYKENGYTENFIIPEGVTIRGGYNPQTWQRDLSNYPTILYIQEGLLLVDSISAIVSMQTDSVLDGFILDAKDLPHAIYVSNASNITVMNTQIDNVDSAIEFNNISGSFINNKVTANITSIIGTNSQDLKILRNHFKSLNQLSYPNLVLQSIQNSVLSNNLLEDGYIGILIQDCSTLTIHNNAISRVEYYGIRVNNLMDSTVYNNVFSHNYVGLFLEIPNNGMFTSDHFYNNFLINNEFHQQNFSINGSNIQKQISTSEWEDANPYFSDIDYFILLPNSDLVDAGSGSDEAYRFGRPSYGSQTNDIGLYGSSYSGRVGIPSVINLSPTDDFSTLINHSYVGDHLVFNSGQFNLTSAIALKPYQYLGGVLSDLSILNHAGADTFLISGSDYNIVEQLYFDGNEKPILSFQFANPLSLSQLIFNNASPAITLQSTSANVQFCTFYQCSTSIDINNNYHGSIDFNIFESNSDIAIVNNSSTPILISHNLFYDNNTDYSGSFIESDNAINSFSSFRSPDFNRFELISSSNGINKLHDYDTGAYEYYHYYAQYRTLPIQNTIDRYYKSLHLNVTPPDDQLHVLSGITIGFINNEQSITLNTPIILDSSTIESKSIDLPPSIIADDMQLIIQLDSYTYGRSPYIKDITLTW